jgi:hypothetical protein
MFLASSDNMAISEVFLVDYLVIRPASGVQFWNKLLATSISFSQESSSSHNESKVQVLNAFEK